MSFSEETARLLRLVDGGVPVPAAASVLGVSKARAYELLKAAGRGRGPKTTINDEHRRVVVEVFTATGNVNRAAAASGLSHDAARRILVVAGLVSLARMPVGKPEAKAKFAELIAQGWSSARAAPRRTATAVRRSDGHDQRPSC